MRMFVYLGNKHTHTHITHIWLVLFDRHVLFVVRQLAKLSVFGFTCVLMLMSVGYFRDVGGGGGGGC